MCCKSQSLGSQLWHLRGEQQDRQDRYTLPVPLCYSLNASRPYSSAYVTFPTVKDALVHFPHNLWMDQIDFYPPFNFKFNFSRRDHRKQNEIDLNFAGNWTSFHPRPFEDTQIIALTSVTFGLMSWPIRIKSKLMKPTIDWGISTQSKLLSSNSFLCGSLA